MRKNRTKVGIIGTGFIATGLYHSIMQSSELQVTVIRSRRKAEECIKLNKELITNSDQELIEKSDIVVECATPIVRKVIEAGIQVITMDSELQITKSDIEHVPAGLMFNVQTKKAIKAGQTIHFNDIILPESEAYKAWINTLKTLKS